jgi:hypothetical protein
MQLLLGQVGLLEAQAEELLAMIQLLMRLLQVVAVAVAGVITLEHALD